MARTGIPRLDSDQSCRGMDWTPMSGILEDLLSPFSLVGDGLMTEEGWETNWRAKSLTE